MAKQFPGGVGVVEVEHQPEKQTMGKFHIPGWHLEVLDIQMFVSSSLGPNIKKEMGKFHSHASSASGKNTMLKFKSSPLFS